MKIYKISIVLFIFLLIPFTAIYANPNYISLLNGEAKEIKPGSIISYAGEENGHIYLTIIFVRQNCEISILSRQQFPKNETVEIDGLNFEIMLSTKSSLILNPIEKP